MAGRGDDSRRGYGFAADRQKVRWQEETRAERPRLAFSADLVRRKIAASISTLEGHIPDSPMRRSAVAAARETVEDLSCRAPDDVAALRLIEAHCAKTYFAAWKGLPIKWQGKARRGARSRTTGAFSTRTSLANGPKQKNVNASHPLNAMLNYAYAVLQARLQVQAIADGYDPTLGIMHHGRRGAPAFVFDLMEPERPKVDASVLAFVDDHIFSATDFAVRTDGVLRLGPQFARTICRRLRISSR